MIADFANEELAVIVSEQSMGLASPRKRLEVDDEIFNNNNFKTSHTPRTPVAALDESIVFGQSEIPANESEF